MDAEATTRNEKIHEALKLLNEAARDKGEEIRVAFGDGYQHLKEAIGHAGGNMKEQVESLKKKVTEGAMHVREVGGEKCKEIAKNVDDQVRQHPWPFIGGVAVSALLLGYILGRKQN